MQDPLLDPVRQRILARMGIQSWQLRAPIGSGHNAEPAQEDNATHEPVVAAIPKGKLWLQASMLPTPALLGDICQWLGISPDDVALVEQLAELPEGHTPPLLWLTAADPRWPEALICPLRPDAAQKRALWQQLRQRSSTASG